MTSQYVIDQIKNSICDMKEKSICFFIIPPYIWMLSSDERSIFYQSLVFSALSPLLGYLPMGIPYSSCKYHCTIGKYPTRGEIPSLNSLWHHRCNSNYSGFFFQPTLKQRKICLKLLKCIIFQIYFHYFFYMLYIKAKPWFILFLISFQKYTSLKRFFMFS